MNFGQISQDMDHLHSTLTSRYDNIFPLDLRRKILPMVHPAGQVLLYIFIPLNIYKKGSFRWVVKPKETMRRPRNG